MAVALFCVICFVVQMRVCVLQVCGERGADAGAPATAYSRCRRRRRSCRRVSYCSTRRCRRCRRERSDDAAVVIICTDNAHSNRRTKCRLDFGVIFHRCVVQQPNPHQTPNAHLVQGTCYQLPTGIQGTQITNGDLVQGTCYQIQTANYSIDFGSTNP